MNDRLTLVNAKLPLTASVAVVGDPVTNKLSLQADATLRLILTELSGAISVYASIIGFSIEKEIFSWDGLHQTVQFARGSLIEADLV